MELRHQERQRFINDVAFGAATGAEELVLICECGRPGCQAFVGVPAAVFSQLLYESSPRVLASDCANKEQIPETASPYVPT